MASSTSLWCAFLSLFFVVFLNPLSCCFVPRDIDSRRAAGASRKRKISFPFCLTHSSESDDHGCHRHKRVLSYSLASIRSCLASAFSFERRHSTDSDNIDQTILEQHVAVGTSANILPGNTAVADTTVRNRSFASRADIFPCTSCGEVFSRAHLLELHQSMKHSLSELSVSQPDSGLNIVRIIFLSCWKGSCTPTVRQVFKIHHSQRTLARFEDYRDMIRSRSSKWCSTIADRDSSMDERCIADGNERLRFYCSTMLCSLGADGVCGSPYCSTCEIIRHGFSGKQSDIGGITTYSSGWGAHASLPKEVEREFELQQVRRTMLVCRVVAGRVAHGGAAEWMHSGAAGRMMFDSVALGTYGGGDELVVFNPKAVLPCFVILY